MKNFKNIRCGTVCSNGDTSLDYYSEGFNQNIRFVHDHRWYDVLPYAPALWIQQYKEDTRSGSWWLHREKYCNICIEYCRAGSAEYTHNGVGKMLPAGGILFTWPGDSVTVSDHDGSSFHRIQLIISGSIAKIAPETLGLLRHRTLLLSKKQEKEWNAMLEKILQVVSNRRDSDAALNSRSAYDVLLFLAKCGFYTSNISSDLPEILTTTLNRMRVGKLEEYSIAYLAQQAGVSRMTLTSLFRKHLNTTPLAYWMKLKMEHAKQLLINSEAPCKAISVELGFRNQLYFSTVFRRYFGMSPTEYRKKHTP